MYIIRILFFLKICNKIVKKFKLKPNYLTTLILKFISFSKNFHFNSCLFYQINLSIPIFEKKIKSSIHVYFGTEHITSAKCMDQIMLHKSCEL